MTRMQLPEIDGISSRPSSDRSDYEHIARLAVADSRVDGGEQVLSAEEAEIYFSTTENLDPSRDLRFVEIDGIPIGYVVTRWYQDLGGPRVYRHMCKLVPEWRSRGIGAAMLRWAQEHLAEIAATHEPGVAKVYRSDVEDSQAGSIRLLEAAGYQAIQHFATLVRPHLDDIPIKELPAGLEIRLVTSDQIRAIWEAEIEAFRGNWGFVEPTDKDWEQFIGFPHRDETLWRIAWAGDQVAGQVKSYINEDENDEFGRRRGWTEDISTSLPWRGRGVASALICESLRELKARGMEEAALGVHVENLHGAFGLYQALGFEVVDSSTAYEKPLG